MGGLIGKALASRLSGDRPSPAHALGVAIVTGVSAGVIAYRALRSDG
jgi:hypothetical protein